MGGQYIGLGMDSEVALNPFDGGKAGGAPDPQKIKFLLALVDIMTREAGDARLPKLERAVIEESIQKVYEEGDKAPSLSRLKDILLAHESVEIRRIGRILAPWCGKTPYGRFFDRDTNISLTRPIVCFDLKGLEDHPDLQAVFLYIITDYVWRDVQMNREPKKVLVLDECWKLLENEAGSGFIGEVFRTFRKYRASAVAISQNIDDFAKSNVAGAVLSNSSIKWILSQKGADTERLTQVLNLNPNELQAISSLKKEHGVFSEAFLIAGDTRTVVAITSTPLEYWIATTDPKDLALLRERERKSPSLSTRQVLEELARDYPRGAALATAGGGT